MSDTLKGYLFALVSALTYGMIPLFMIPLKKLDFFSVDTALFYRFLIAAILILGYLVFYQKESVKINLKEGFVLSILGLFYALSAEFLFIAYDFLSPGIASTIFFIYPIMVALILGIFFKEKITLATTISLVIVVVGVGILSIKDNFEINYIGLFVSLLGALMYALYMIIVNKTKINASGVKVSFYSMVFASLFFLVKTIVLGNSVAIPSLEIGTHLALFSLITPALSVVDRCSFQQEKIKKAPSKRSFFFFYISNAFFSALARPSKFFPPAVAKPGFPPPPPWISFARSFTMFPA